ncbi:MAG: hypothetical protein MUE83_04750, partial [Tabrizicola sp.]|nr:hypothetical protein [Tabrizicola sp.]
MNRFLRKVFLVFRTLGPRILISAFGPKTANLVQTAATFGGPYSVIPSDIGRTERQIEAVKSNVDTLNKDYDHDQVLRFPERRSWRR